MTNLEYYRHEIAYCMDVGCGWGVINNVPVLCGRAPCKDCILYKGRDPREDEAACDTEKIIDWMLAEYEEGNSEEEKWEKEKIDIAKAILGAVLTATKEENDAER